MMAAPPDVMNHGTSGITAPAQNAANDEVAAPAGDPSSSGSMPSSSRAWVRTASSSPAMTDSARARAAAGATPRSEEHTSELQSLMRISYAVFFLQKNKH